MIFPSALFKPTATSSPAPGTMNIWPISFFPAGEPNTSKLEPFHLMMTVLFLQVNFSSNHCFLGYTFFFQKELVTFPS
jgi:hypothetical protein